MKDGLSRRVAARAGSLLLIVAGAAVWSGEARAQEAGRVVGTVVIAATGDPVHGARVLVVNTGRSATTDADGRYEVVGVPAGTYDVFAQREHFTAERQRVTVAPGEAAEANFGLRLSAVHEHITVTAAAAGEVTAFEAFNSVTTLDSFDLSRLMAPTIGEALENEPGIARRAFGPGSSRPIIRGFDGDRVLIMQDGIRTGDLSSQSGDHGVSIDPGGLERLEVVKGPATLLYGSNAVGGVVNAITPHDAFRSAPQQGLRGQLTTDAGSANAQAGAAGSLQFAGGPWTVWGGGSSRRTGDYGTPLGVVENSAIRLSSGRAGVGYLGSRFFASFGYQGETGRYGIPFAGEFHGHGEEDHGGDGEDEEEFVDVDHRRHALRFDAGLRNLETRFVESARLTVNRLDWQHRELEIEAGVEEIGTRFDNDAVVFRADVQQRRVGRMGGRFGVSGTVRDYLATGAEALAPPTRQNTLAGFSFQELDFDRFRVQFGGRVERNAYRPGERENGHDDHDDDHDQDLEPPAARDRTFTGASASAGIHLDLAAGTALVGNVTRSYRAPSLEELFNFGPHVGNLAFEIGNPDLDRESILGLDASLRHRSAGRKAELNVFRYGIDNFVFPSLTGDEEDGLRVVEFLQGDSRFTGFDASGHVELHGRVAVNVGAGYVRATLTGRDEPLPRIPPFHGRVSLDVPYNGFTVTPEVVWAARQARVFGGETATAGYGVLNLKGSYVLGTAHAAHIVSVRAFNLTNALYRNHTSFIKDLAPELGRGVRVAYTVRFF